MTRTQHRGRGWIAGALAGLAVGLWLLPCPSRAAAQTGSRQQIGSVSARAPHSSVTLGRAQTTVELTGGVSIQTDTGDLMRAQRITLTVGQMPDPKRPGRTKTDVRTADASGDVSFKRVQTVRPANGAPYQRVISGSAARGVLDRANQQLVLTQDVQVRSEEPDGTYTLQNVAAAKVTLGTNSVTADAPTGGKMRLFGRMTVKPETGAPYVRTVNGSARHGEMDRAANEVVLTGDVDISAEEPAATYTWNNAAKATVHLTKGNQKIEADAPNGQQMQVNVHFKNQGQASAGRIKRR